MSDLTPQGAAAVRLAASVVSLRGERDRARSLAVALEQRLARVERLTRDLLAIHAEVVMDTPTDQALHGSVIDTFRAALEDQ